MASVAEIHYLQAVCFHDNMRETAQVGKDDSIAQCHGFSNEWIRNPQVGFTRNSQQSSIRPCYTACTHLVGVQIDSRISIYFDDPILRRFPPKTWKHRCV